MTSASPDATASSTAYWIVGLSTRGSISLGWAFVAGRKRVPRPAAGNTAFLTRVMMPLFEHTRPVRETATTTGPRGSVTGVDAFRPGRNAQLLDPVPEAALGDAESLGGPRLDASRALERGHDHAPLVPRQHLLH